MSDLFCLYVAKDVVSKHLRPAKKLIFRARQLDAGSEFEFEKMQSANEIGQLKQPIARRPDGVCELDVASDACLKHLVKHASNRRLSTVIVDFHAVKRCDEIMVFRDKTDESRLESLEYLCGGVDELFVDAQAMVFIVNSSGKGHHAREDPSAKLAAEHGVVFLSANERPCVEAMPLKPDFSVGPFKAVDFVGYVDGLIVKYHADDVKAGFGVGEVEIPRLVYENAQCRCIHGMSPKKREWRDENPATHAESFPRIPVTPAITRRSVGILPNHGYERKGEMSVSAEFAEFEVAA